jgi:metal transporter CNNM
LTSGLAGFFISTALIVVFGEIIPQALCSRHALAIGSRMVPHVRVLLALFYAFAKPIAFVLDCTVGEDMGTIFSKRELEKILVIHVKRQMLHPSEGHIVRGAMKNKTKQVGRIMKSVEQIYTLPARIRLDSDKIKEIYKHGFSRIPVWDKGINDIIGIVFVKDFVYINQKEEIPLYDFVQVFGHGIHRVWVDSPLGEVLQVFKKGKLHMALVSIIEDQ